MRYNSPSTNEANVYKISDYQAAICSHNAPQEHSSITSKTVRNETLQCSYVHVIDYTQFEMTPCNLEILTC